MNDPRSTTQSLCPVCLRRIPARRLRSGATVLLDKNCPEHGNFQTPIWRGEPDFEGWPRPKRDSGRSPTSVLPIQPGARQGGCPFDCGLCPSHRQRTCTLVVEVTQRCNLQCPICFADAGDRPGIDPCLETLRLRFQQLRETAGECNLQLSGGEPTLRDDLPEIVSLARQAGFGFVQLNTNGLRLAADAHYVAALKRAGLASVFLQFDGTRDEIYRSLRGRGLVQQKMQAMAACREAGLGVVLVPTLMQGVNCDNVGEILHLAMRWTPTVRGVHFQPISYFGRYSGRPTADQRVTLPEVMHAVETQTQGRFRREHLAPPGCENGWCSFHATYVILTDGSALPLPNGECCAPPRTAEQGAQRSIACVARQWAGPQALTHPDDSRPAVSSTAGCSAAGSLSLDQFIQRARQHTFSVSAMAFMDAWTLDLERVQECCIHVASEDGRRIPFCLYNLSASDGRRLYRS